MLDLAYFIHRNHGQPVSSIPIKRHCQRKRLIL